MDVLANLFAINQQLTDYLHTIIGVVVLWEGMLLENSSHL